MKIIAILAAATLCVSIPHQEAKAQLVVSDLLAEIGISKGAVETVKNGITAAQQLQTAAQQLQWAISLTTSLVHDPSLGTVMQLANMLGLDTDIPINLYAVQSLVSGYGGIGSVNGLMGTLGGKLGALGNVVNTTYSHDNLYTCQSNSFYCAQTNTNMTGLSAAKGMVGTMMSSLQNHLLVLNGLQAKLATSGNLKDTADINAEIAAQQTWFTGQAAQISAVNAMSQMQQQVSSEQAKQSWWQSVDTFNAAAK